jgi:catechol 2,3-dioxygenase-like lactoylglutathione lyase family enzyme
MVTGISHFSIWVTDQDAALDFYVGKLGLEINTDVQLDFMRWLTVSIPGQPEQEIILAPLQAPIIDPDNAQHANDLLAKGFMGNLILTTEDCRATYTQLLAAGVEFTQEPTEQPYGLECVVRDPFGNQIRIAQRAPKAVP